MSIKWGGSIQVDGSARTRTGISYDVSSVSHGSSTCKITVTYWLGQRYHEDRQMTLHYGGAQSGTDSFQNDHGTNGDSSYHTVKIASHTYTYTYSASSYGSSPGTRTFNAYIATGLGSTPSVSVTVRIPARPVAKPAAPTNVTASWSTFGAHTLQGWTRHSTAAAPYRKIQVQYGYFDAGGWQGYVDGAVVNLSAGASHYYRAASGNNRAYRYRVRAGNDAGWSAWATMSPSDSALYGTPAAPSGVKAKTSSGGDSITLTWTANSYVHGSTTQVVQRSVNGGSWANVKTGLGPSAQSWTDSSPGAGSNQYRVQVVHAKEKWDSSDVSSAWATSNTVSTIVPPLAPDGLSPDGGTFDLSQDVVLSWVYHDGGDGADQTKFSIQYSTDGGSNWLEVEYNVESSASQYVLAGGTLANGATYQWRVVTEGVESAYFGPFSDAATITGSSAPTVSITDPTGTVTSGNNISVSFDYSQDQSSALAVTVISLYDSTGETLLEQRKFTGVGGTRQFTGYHGNGSYVVQVQCQSAAGIWSAVASQAFTVTVPVPATVSTDAEYQYLTGTVVLSMTPDTPGTGEADTLAVTVERSIDGGAWVTLAVDMPVPVDFVDPLPTVAGSNTYRVTSISAEPGYRVNDLVAVYTPSGIVSVGTVTDNGDGTFTISGATDNGDGTFTAQGLTDNGDGTFTVDDSGAADSTAWADPDRQWAFVSYGDGFGNILRLRCSIQVSQAVSGTVALAARLGQALPRPRFGVNQSRKVTVQGTAVYTMPGDDAGSQQFDSPRGDWEALAVAQSVVCLRDFTGRRMFGVVDGGVALDDTMPRMTGVSFAVSECDFVEAYG